MTFAESTLRWQQWLLAAMLLASAVLVLPSAVEPFMLPKITAVVGCAILLALVVAFRAASTRQVHVPLSFVSYAVTAFVLAAVVTTATSGEPLTSLLGYYGRYTGLIPYLAYVLAFFMVLRLCDASLIRTLSRTALIALGLVVAYGLLQAVGLDPVDYGENVSRETFSFLGNTNFGGAWAGAVLPLALNAAVTGADGRAWRIYAGVLLASAAVYVVMAAAAQGLAAALVGAAWTVGVLVSTPGDRIPQLLKAHKRVVLGVAGAAALVLGIAVVAAVPFVRAELQSSLVERPFLWSVAVAILADSPVIGTGLDTYAHHFLAYRPVGHALLTGTAGADAPHSVPLGMFSNGGLLLGLSYLAVVATVAVVLVRGIATSTGADRVVVAGWGGVWLGYQLQALVSFDVPPLALLHWISAGVVVATIAPPRWRGIGLPGASAGRPRNVKGKAYAAAAVPVSTRVLYGLAGVIALAALWFAAYPLRADLVAASAAPLTSSGQLDEAVERFERASALNPAEASYPFLAAQAHAAAGRPGEAYAAATEAARRDPGQAGYALLAAQQASLRDREDLVAEWSREAVQRDPHSSRVLDAVAENLLQLGEAAQAQRLLQHSVEVRPQAVTYVLLGYALLAQEDSSGARFAAEKALELEPRNEAAKDLLSRLS